MRLNAHYFEDGNLMFKIDKMLEGAGSSSGGGIKDLAEAVASKIVGLE